MNEFQLYNETNAPDLSKESLIKVKKNMVLFQMSWPYLLNHHQL